MKLLEHYTSIQGEGPNTGKPTHFIRFAGCNMRCPGWPCDTPQAIFPEQYQNEYEKISPEALIDRVQLYPRRVCLTGGEPFIQKDLGQFVWLLLQYGFKIDIFTNGSQPVPDIVWNNSEEVTIIQDWKLRGSGEADSFLDNRTKNAKLLGSWDAIKFVVASDDDLVEALETWESLKQISCKAEYWIGAAWGCIQDKVIVDFVLEHHLPWRLNIQTHKHIWDPEARYT